LMQTCCLILPSVTDKIKSKVEKALMYKQCVHSTVSRGRLMQYACRSVTLSFLFIFFHWGSLGTLIEPTIHMYMYLSHSGCFHPISCEFNLDWSARWANLLNDFLRLFQTNYRTVYKIPNKNLLAIHIHLNTNCPFSHVFST
jgi:hypothetical protein